MKSVTKKHLALYHTFHKMILLDCQCAGQTGRVVPYGNRPSGLSGHKHASFPLSWPSEGNPGIINCQSWHAKLPFHVTSQLAGLPRCPPGHV